MYHVPAVLCNAGVVSGYAVLWRRTRVDTGQAVLIVLRFYETVRRTHPCHTAQDVGGGQAAVECCTVAMTTGHCGGHTIPYHTPRSVLGATAPPVHTYRRQCRRQLPYTETYAVVISLLAGLEVPCSLHTGINATLTSVQVIIPTIDCFVAALMMPGQTAE